MIDLRRLTAYAIITVMLGGICAGTVVLWLRLHAESPVTAWIALATPFVMYAAIWAAQVIDDET